MNNKREVQIALAVIALIVASWAAWILYKTYTARPKPQMVAAERMLCYDLHTAFLTQEGWRRATPADRPHMIAMARRGMLEWREEKSLQCHDTLDPKTEWMASELWFRPKMKRSGDGLKAEGQA